MEGKEENGNKLCEDLQKEKGREEKNMNNKREGD